MSEQVFLPLLVTSNYALNADEISQRRKLDLIQGETYTVNLKFLSGTETGNVPVSPVVEDFIFAIRELSTSPTDLLRVSGVTAQTGAYPYSFSFVADSLGISAALSGVEDWRDLSAHIFYSEDSQEEIYEPFYARFTPTNSGTVIAAYVETINDQSGPLTLTGAGNVSVSTVGSVLTVSGDVSALATKAALAATGAALTAANATQDSRLSFLENQTGSYVLHSETGALLDSSDLAALEAADAGLQTQISTLQSQTGSYATAANLAATGAALAAADTALDSRLDALEAVSGSFATQAALAATGAALNAADAALDGRLDVLEGQTGTYYPAANPSGFITSAALAPYALTSAVDAADAGLAAQIAATGATLAAADSVLSSRVGTLEGQTGNYVLHSQTGAFLDASDLAPYALTSAVDAADAALDSRIDALEGVSGTFATQAALAATGAALVAADSALQGQITTLANATGSYTLHSETGAFYAASNPAGYITSAALAPYALSTELAATGATLVAADANLQSQITTLQGQTGSYLTAIPADVVRTTGDQTIGGLKTFNSGLVAKYYWNGNTGLDTVFSTLRDEENVLSLNWNNRVMSDASNVTAINWNQRDLKSSTNGDSINWENRIAYNSSSNPSINWETKVLFGTAGYVSWDEALLLDGIAVPSVAWGARQLSGNWLTDTVPTLSTHIVNKGYLDSAISAVTVSNVVYTTGDQNVTGLKKFNGGLIATYSNGATGFNATGSALYDTSNVRAAEWNVRALYGSNSFLRIHWDECQFRDKNNSTAIYGHTRQLWDSGFFGSELAVDWHFRQLSGTWSTNTTPTQNAHLVNKGYLDSASGALDTRITSLDSFNVKTTGSQTISGTKTFATNIIVGTKLNTSTETLGDGTDSVRWGARELVDNNGDVSIAWDASALALKDAGNTTLHWSNLQLSGDWQTDTVPTIDAHLINKGYFDSTLDSEITALNAVFYPLAGNPSNYVTASQTGAILDATVVRTTGNQTITGQKIFQSGLVATFSNGVTGLNVSTQTLRTTANKVALSWQNRTLYNASELTVIDWDASYAYSNGTLALDWGTRRLMDDNESVSVHWNNRVLADTLGNDSVSWGTRTLSSANGYLDWGNCRLLDISEAFTLDWVNRQLSGNWSTNTFPTQSGHLINKGWFDSISGTLGGGLATIPDDVVRTTGTQTISGTKTFVNPAEQQQTLTCATGISWDMNNGGVAKITLTGNPTMLNPSNVRNGATYVLEIVQGTGNSTLSWGSNFVWPAATTPTITTTSGKRDIATFVALNSKMYASIAQNFA